MSEVPLSLYVHLPWCVSKCPYCDFNSHTAGDSPPLERYVGALLADIAAESEHAADRELISIFVGGGTPSLFTPQQIGRLLDETAKRFRLAADIEVTMEANPGTVECGDPAGYRDAGVNRLSIGAQSFSTSSLAMLGRIHDVDDIRRSFVTARDAGFDNINVDIMYGLPQQRVAAAIADIEEALQLGPEHVSWYQLTLEPNTVFYARPPEGMPDDDLVCDIQRQGQRLLAEHGYRQYEVSAYAIAGRECRHNLNYWSFGDYLAVGAGAHAKVTGSDGIYRYIKPANPQRYMQTIESGDHATEMSALSTPDLLFEFMINALRLNEGFDETLFESRTGLDPSRLAEAAAGAVDRGLIRRDDERKWRPTSLGQRFLNDLQAEFLP